LKLLVFVSLICIISYNLFIDRFNPILYSKQYLLSDVKFFVNPLFSGILTSISSSLLNNFPSIFISTHIIKSISVSMDMKELVSYSSIIGNVIGAKFIPIGSVSTIIWLNILKTKGIRITFKEYILSSAILTLPVFLLCLIVLGIIV
jgi:arsenical pump membrane protein